MQATGWIELLRKIPRSQHDNLSLFNDVGCEFAVQAVLRTEEELLIFRGRVAGTDGSRIFFVPYERILLIGFQKEMKEAQFDALYGGVSLSLESPPAAEETTAAEPAAPAPEASPEPAAFAAPAKPEGARPALANKSALLERIRSRSAQPGGGPPAGR